MSYAIQLPTQGATHARHPRPSPLPLPLSIAPPSTSSVSSAYTSRRARPALGFLPRHRAASARPPARPPRAAPPGVGLSTRCACEMAAWTAGWASGGEPIRALRVLGRQPRGSSNLGGADGAAAPAGGYRLRDRRSPAVSDYCHYMEDIFSTNNAQLRNVARALRHATSEAAPFGSCIMLFWSSDYSLQRMRTNALHYMLPRPSLSSLHVPTPCTNPNRSLRDVVKHHPGLQPLQEARNRTHAISRLECCSRKLAFRRCMTTELQYLQFLGCFAHNLLQID